MLPLALIVGYRVYLVVLIPRFEVRFSTSKPSRGTIFEMIVGAYASKF